MKSKLLLALAVCMCLSSTAFSEDLDAMFGRVKELVAAKNYSKAIEEMQWAEKEIQKMNSVQVQTFFPDNLAGFTGGKFESTNVMGISNMERTYTKGAQSVKLSMTGSGGGGLGGLAALGKMAAMFGNEPGTDSVRIAGRTAQIQTGQGSGTDLTVFLDSGSVLKFESSQGDVDGPTLKTMAEAVQIEALDTYLRGTSK